MSSVLLALIASQVLAFIGVQAWLALSWARWRWVTGETARVGPVGVIRLLLRETRAVYVIASYYVRAIGRSGLRIPRQPQGRPVLAVHGFTQNATNMWGVRMELERRGRPTLAVHLGRPLQGLDGYVPRLVQGLRVLLDLHESVDVVCHSMGGVILRKALAAHPELAQRVHHIVTLGSPHRGTHAAVGFEWLSADVRGLALGSAELDALPTLAELAPHALITTVSGAWDLVCYPEEGVHEPRSKTVRLAELGHCGLIVDRRALGVVAEAVGG